MQGLQKLQSHKVKIAVAIALAAEWALAFAFARRFALAVADANAEGDIAFANAIELSQLAARVGALEADHGYPSRPDHHRVRSGVDEGSRV